MPAQENAAPALGIAELGVVMKRAEARDRASDYAERVATGGRHWRGGSRCSARAIPRIDHLAANLEKQGRWRDARPLRSDAVNRAGRDMQRAGHGVVAPVGQSVATGARGGSRATTMIASAILSTVIPVAMAPDAPAVSTFTPLDAIDRVRREECGIDTFPTFLEWYAGATHTGRWLEEVVFTDYMVRVGRMNDPKGSAQMIDRQDYLGQFRITSRDYRAGEAAGAATPDARRITLKRFAPDRYRVDWQGGPGFAGVEGADRFARGRAYMFEHRKDCWYLTGDLR